MDTRGSFLAGSNRANSTIANLGGISAVATTVSVASNPTLFPTDGGAITIDNEILYYTARVGNALNGLLRGQDGTTAATHNFGATISMKIIAQHVNGHSDSIIELERKLGTGSDVAALNEFLIGVGTGATAYGPLTSGHVTTALGFTPLTSARQVNTTAPLAGGGNLGSDLTLSIVDASVSVAGVVNTTIQSFAGAKTFTGITTFIGAPVNEGGWSSTGSNPLLFGGAHSTTGVTPSVTMQRTQTGGGTANIGIHAFNFGLVSSGLVGDGYAMSVLYRYTNNLTSFAAGDYFQHGIKSYVIGAPTNVVAGKNTYFYNVMMAEAQVPGITFVGVQPEAVNNSGTDAPNLANTVFAGVAVNAAGGGVNQNSTAYMAEATAGSLATSFYNLMWPKRNSVRGVMQDYSTGGIADLTGPVTLTLNSTTVTRAAAVSVSVATNATPIVVTTASHAFIDGERVTVASVGGNTAANGTWYVDVLSSTTFALYSDPVLTVGVAGNGTYTSGGTATGVTKFTRELQVGDQVTADGVTYYEVASTPVSDTTFTLTSNYLGSTTNTHLDKNVIAMKMIRPSYIVATDGTNTYRMIGPDQNLKVRLDNDGRTIIAGSGTGTQVTDSAGKILSAALNTVGVPQGGTGGVTFTSNGVIYGNGTSALQVTAQGLANSVFTANAGAPGFTVSPLIGLNLITNANFTNRVTVGAMSGQETFPGIWFLPSSTSLTLNNYAFLADVASNITILNGPTAGGSISLRINNTDKFVIDSSGFATSTVDNATTALIDDIHIITHTSTGTPANGLGSGILFKLESNTPATRDASRIATRWIDVVDATRTAAVTIETASSGTLTEAARFDYKTGNTFTGLGTPGIFTRVAAASPGGVQGAAQYGLSGFTSLPGDGPSMLFFATDNGGVKGFVGRVSAVVEASSGGAVAPGGTEVFSGAVAINVRKDADDTNATTEVARWSAAGVYNVFKGADINSATAAGTIVPTGNLFHVTGTTGITAITTTNIKPGTTIRIIFDGALTITHNGSTLFLTGATNFTTSANDILEFSYDGSKWFETARVNN